MAEIVGPLRQPEVINPPNLRQELSQAIAHLRAEQEKPQAVAAREAGRASLLQDMWELNKDYNRKHWGNEFKKLKAGLMLVTSLIPVVGEGAAAARSLEKAEKLGKRAGKLETKGSLWSSMFDESGLKTAAALQKERARILRSLKPAQLSEFNSAVARGLGRQEALQVAMLAAKDLSKFHAEIAAGRTAGEALEYVNRGCQDDSKGSEY